MDWAGSVQSIDDVRAPFVRLKQETDASDQGAKLVLDADFASELIAAAETVAMLLGGRSHDFPDDLATRLADAGEPENLLFHQSRNAVLHVMRRSELADLWAEAARETGTNQWLAELTRLIDRLNPEVEAVPWKPEHLESKVGKLSAAQTCAFCDNPIDPEELWSFSIYNASNMRGIGRGFWIHLPCLNARMHHGHAIADLKFDPNNLPDLSKL